MSKFQQFKISRKSVLTIIRLTQQADGHTGVQNCWNLKLLVSGVAKNSLGESKDVQNVQMYVYNTCGENVDIPELAATLKVKGSQLTLWHPVVTLLTTKFNLNQFYAMPARCVRVLWVDLRRSRCVWAKTKVRIKENYGFWRRFARHVLPTDAESRTPEFLWCSHLWVHNVT